MLKQRCVETTFETFFECLDCDVFFKKWWIFNHGHLLRPLGLDHGSCEKSCGRLRNDRSTNIPHLLVASLAKNGFLRNSFCLSLGISHVKIESSFEKNPQNLFKSCSLAFGVEEMFQTKARRHRGTVSKEHAFAYPTPC